MPARLLSHASRPPGTQGTRVLDGRAGTCTSGAPNVGRLSVHVRVRRPTSSVARPIRDLYLHGGHLLQEAAERRRWRHLAPLDTPSRLEPARCACSLRPRAPPAQAARHEAGVTANQFVPSCSPLVHLSLAGPLLSHIAGRLGGEHRPRITTPRPPCDVHASRRCLQFPQKRVIVLER